MVNTDKSGDPRRSQNSQVEAEFKSITVNVSQEGAFEGEWSARSRKKKFRRRKFTVYFDNPLSYIPLDIEFSNVQYTGTTGLALVKPPTNKKFVCYISSNDIGSTAKVSFNWKTIK